MNANELRELNPDELQRKVLDLKETFFNLRFQNEIGQLENPSKMKEIRREIARTYTVLNEVKFNSQSE